MITKEQKIWFGNCEYDIDLMIKLGILSEDFIYDAVRIFIDSPWYDEKYAQEYKKK